MHMTVLYSIRCNSEITECLYAVCLFVCLFTFPGQIYKLMKMDSYARFVRSALYQNCMLAGVEGRPLPDLVSQNKCVTPTSGRKVTFDFFFHSFIHALVLLPCTPTSKQQSSWYILFKLM